MFSFFIIVFNMVKLLVILFIIFVSQFTVLLANSVFIANTIDTAIIRSRYLVVFCKKGVLTNFAKFPGKHLR